jgi:hypothetical protein
MRSSTARRRVAAYFRLKDAQSAVLRWLCPVIAVAMSFAMPSPGSAQTLDLGQAGGFGVFAVSDPISGNTGDFNFSQTTVDGRVALGASTFLGGQGTIYGSVSQDPTASFSGVAVLGSINSSSSLGTYLSQLGQTVMNTATTAQGWNSANANQLTPTIVNGNNYEFTGSTAHSGQNVITINSNTNSGLLNLSNATITINGTSSEQFVFNFTGRTTLTDVNVVLNGVSLSNVFYNFISGNVGINSSKLDGTVLDVINGTSMSVDNSTIHGAIMSDGFVDMANSVVAPEIPSIMVAGLGCLIVLGNAGLKRLRRAPVS